MSLLLHLCFAGPCSGLGDKVPSPIPVVNATGSIFQVKLVRLVGIMLLLYVKADLALNISEVEVETVGTGIMGRMVRMTTVCETLGSPGELHSLDAVVIPLAKGGSCF